MADDVGEPIITRRAALYALAAILGGSGGSLVTDILKDPRPDPYTGRDGLRDKVEIMKRLDRQRDAMETLKDKLHAIELHHQDIENQVRHHQDAFERFQRHIDSPKHTPRPH